jgi:hypothetical protein
MPTNSERAVKDEAVTIRTCGRQTSSRSSTMRMTKMSEEEKKEEEEEEA